MSNYEGTIHWLGRTFTYFLKRDRMLVSDTSNQDNVADKVL
jgi:hypothetical protein